MANPERSRLFELLFKRYPAWEWATFARFGWRATEEALVLTLAGLDEPNTGDLDEGVGHVAISEPYTLRNALAAEHHPLAVGVVHSHPLDCAPRPSVIDDDMDAYYSQYLSGFAPGRPYISLIASRMNGELVLGGRVWWQEQWLNVHRFLVDDGHAVRSTGDGTGETSDKSLERVARLAAAFGQESAIRLREATVGVVGAGGTGSAAIESLARAGVGRLIVVDPDHLEASNLERVHGSEPLHALHGTSKALIAHEHVRRINPACEVVALAGALPQEKVIDSLVTADVVLGCTDQQHSRLALSDLALRYLVPSIDCGVMLEGDGGKVSAQVIQLLRFLPSDPCALCRDIVDPNRVAQELMTAEDQAQRRRAAREAEQRGDSPDPYWQGTAQLNTVGYLTTAAASLAAGYAIGWLTGRFVPPFSRLQLDLLARDFSVVSWDQDPRPNCICRRNRGWADQGRADALMSAPDHWPPVVRVQ